MTAIHEAIRELADTFGVQREYRDNWGKLHRVPLTMMLSILAAKGVHIQEHLVAGRGDVRIMSQGELASPLPVTFHEHNWDADSPPALESVTLRLSKTDETPRRHTCDSGRCSFRLDPVTRQADLTVPLPPDLPVGEYDVELCVQTSAGELRHSSRWFICPDRAYVPRRLREGGKLAGVCIAVYGLRSERNWGAGDFSDLQRFLGWAADQLQVDFVGVNPLHAIFNRRPYNTSPYLPSSRLFLNHLYLDVPAVPELRFCPNARALIDEPSTRDNIATLREAEYVPYEEVSALKLTVLQAVFSEWQSLAGSSPDVETSHAEVASFIESQGPYLERFAVFCALNERYLGMDPPIYSWRDWPEEFRDPLSPAVESFAQDNRDEVRFWMFLQWQLSRQLAQCQQVAAGKGMLIGLYNDHALAVDRHGADFWAMQDLFHDGFRVGAPPDDFSPHGQDWGFSPPDRDRMRSDHYRSFRQRIRANCAHGGALRIDHVMQFNRLFWIPEGHPPAEGAYVQDYETELLNLLALESRRSRTMIIGEDLGTVPYGMRDRLMEKRVLSYRLFYFEKDANGRHLPAYRYPEYAMVSVSTHDLPTLAGFWSGWDIDARLRSGILEPQDEESARRERREAKDKMVERLADDGFITEDQARSAINAQTPPHEVHQALIAFLMSTPSALVAINQEDLFLDQRQQNLPGTTGENPNWMTRMRFTLEELETTGRAQKQTAMFRSLAQRYGRSRSV